MGFATIYYENIYTNDGTTITKQGSEQSTFFKSPLPYNNYHLPTAEEIRINETATVFSCKC